MIRFEEVQPTIDITVNPKTDIGEGPFYFKGWFKWLSYNPSVVPDIRNFFVNEAWYDQAARMNSTKEMESDDFGTVDIPDKTHFFFVMGEEAIYVFSARRNDVSKVVRSMNLVEIQPEQVGRYEGGVEDLGNFNEGFCFRINAMNKATEEVWAICSDEKKLKAEFMLKAAVLMLRKKPPRKNKWGMTEGEYDLSEAGKAPPADVYPEIGPDGQPVNVYIKKPDGKGPVNGKWVILSDWSTCTLACGGGTMTQQRQCIPPQNGGEPCVGDAINVKECNVQPCESVVVEKGEELPTKIRMQKVSKRFQRYETCILKEGDVEIVKTDLTELKIKPRFPGRAIMNNQTFSVFQSDGFDSLLFTSPLEFIRGVIDYKDDPLGCFVVADSRTHNKITLCAVKTDKDYVQSKKNWVSSIAFFRDNCHLPLKQKENNPDEVIEMKKNALKHEEMEGMSFGSQEIAVKGGMGDNMKKLQKMAVDALQKEMKYEQLMFNEEKMKEKEDEKEYEKKMEELRERQDCARRDMKKRALKGEVKSEAKEMDFNFGDIEQTIKNMVLKKRKEAAKRLEIMKKMSEIRKKQKGNKMQEMRVEMASEMLNAEHAGDTSICFITDKDKKKDYCNKNFGEDFNTNLDCRSKEYYCYICCEKELGNIFFEERQQCFDKCSKLEATGGSGGWVFLPPSAKVQKPKEKDPQV